MTTTNTPSAEHAAPRETPNSGATLTTTTATTGLTRVGVIGGGLMGSGIAEVCARRGLDVVVTEINNDSQQAATSRIQTSLARATRAGKMTAAQAQSTTARIRVVVGLGDQSDRELIIEAATEREDLKLQVFTDLDDITGADTILASNTSSIPIAKLATATKRPDRVIGIHFFNPAPVQPLVEIIPSLLTSPETLSKVELFASETLGKQIILAKDRAGFIVNALLIPYLLSAVRMLESGLASADDIDTGMRLGCAHPMGPLHLADLVGLDTVRSAAASMLREYGDVQYAPPALLSRMVESGLLGRKTGQGFFPYPT